MKIELISDKEKAMRPSELRIKMVNFPRMPGETVCYEQPLYRQALLNCQSAIPKSNALEKLRNRFYRIESNNGYIFEVYPAVEYYKIAFRMIRDNLHTIMIAQDEIMQSVSIIQTLFRERKELLPSGQSKISFDKEIYRLRSGISTFAFSTRAILDTLATLVQTIYGPACGQYVSFSSLLKQLGNAKGAIQDGDLSAYVRSELEWFKLLKDVRDYLAHFGALHFSLKEQPPAPVTIEIFHKIEVSYFASTVYGGLTKLLTFLDAHWTEALNNA